MCLAANIENPPSSLGEGCNSSTELLKNKVFDLKELAYISTFDQMSFFVETMSGGTKYIACPNGASSIDKDECLFKIQESIFMALKNIEKRRKNGRDTQLIKAASLGDSNTIANIITSCAWTYWQDHGFFSGLNLHNKLAVVSQVENIEKNVQNITFFGVQIEHIGAVISFEKAKKKGAFQEVLDFDETILIMQEVESNER